MATMVGGLALVGGLATVSTQGREPARVTHGLGAHTQLAASSLDTLHTGWATKVSNVGRDGAG